MICEKNNRLVYHYDAEEVWVEAWGENSLRIRATKNCTMPDEQWALLSVESSTEAMIQTDESGGWIQNGKCCLHISKAGKITISNQENKVLLKEYWRNRRDVRDEKCSAIEVEGREFKPNIGGHYALTARFESLDTDEKIYGMGQYQQPHLNLKGTDMELAHRNSQASVPFMISSLGYGILWNNPAIGRVVFGKNVMSYEAFSTQSLDYWVTVGDTPAEMVETYADVTGTVPMMPEYGLGFWQCKLRYQNQAELLEVAREYKRRDLPIDVIVIDFFHWAKQGDWKFDPTYWPNPEEMIRELKDMDIELMVSVWPTVDKESENFEEMLEKGYLVRTERGYRLTMDFEGNTIHYDATNPDARKYLWAKAKENYYDKGIRIFWLDEAEPEYSVYDFDNYRYYKGTDLEIGNLYPRDYAKTFYQGMQEEKQHNIVNLIRCAWAGSQKYGTLVWSGDIASSFDSMRNQLVAGLNMGIAGIPWWTTDIGGFHGGNPDDAEFRELFARWFAWGAFCPVMRLHGDREPVQPQQGTTGGAHCCSGASNEVWSYGEEIYDICVKYMNIRENMREYTRKLMKEAHEKGTPIMRPLFYEFPNEVVCWEIEDTYMYGSDYLVAPVLDAGVTSRKVFLPSGNRWENFEDGKEYEGGQWVEVAAPLAVIPVFMVCK